jgi:hypothetical protein
MALREYRSRFLNVANRSVNRRALDMTGKLANVWVVGFENVVTRLLASGSSRKVSHRGGSEGSPHSHQIAIDTSPYRQQRCRNRCGGGDNPFLTKWSSSPGEFESILTPAADFGGDDLTSHGLKGCAGPQVLIGQAVPIPLPRASGCASHQVSAIATTATRSRRSTGPDVCPEPPQVR